MGWFTLTRPASGTVADSRYAVIGNPIGHSRSPFIHREFAELTGRSITYEPLLAPVGEFAGAVDAFRAAGGRGLNVTAPFKLDAAAYATQLRQDAELAGAVNAMLFDGSDAVADNFDGLGLVRDIVANLHCILRHRRILLLGAGGAARGAIPLLLRERPAELVVANRDRIKAARLAERFASHGTVLGIGLDGLHRHRDFDVIINATTASLHGEQPDINGEVFGPECLAYDMVYGKGLTPFLRSPGTRVRSAWRTVGGCWSSKRPKRSIGGMASGQTPGT